MSLVSLDFFFVPTEGNLKLTSWLSMTGHQASVASSPHCGFSSPAMIPGPAKIMCHVQYLVLSDILGAGCKRGD